MYGAEFLYGYICGIPYFTSSRPLPVLGLYWTFMKVNTATEFMPCGAYLFNYLFAEHVCLFRDIIATAVRFISTDILFVICAVFLRLVYNVK